MPRGSPSVPADTFVRDFEGLGAAAFSRKHKVALRAVYLRRASLERELGRPIRGPDHPNQLPQFRPQNIPQRLNFSVTDGVVIVASDNHYWPGMPKPLMHRALVNITKQFKQERSLRAVVLNGDVFDFPGMSRFGRADWERRPSVKAELEVGAEMVQEIEEAAGRALKFRTRGNHDDRFSNYIASHARELEGLRGVHVTDYIPLWEPCGLVEINDGYDTTLVTHFYRMGKYAPDNNILNSGVHMITGHMHSAKVTQWTFRNHTVYGVDSGCIADPYGPQFGYLIDAPRNWRSGFAVLTYKGGKLLYPQLCLGWDKDHVQFRGEVFKP